jgi:hypothetical protein
MCPALIYFSDLMNRTEFEQLRDLPDKRIAGNITFSLKNGSRPIHVIEPLAVQNSLGIDLVLQGSYNPEIKKLTLRSWCGGPGQFVASV